MQIIKLGASVIALITALGGFMSWKYGTTSPCEAAGTAIRDEMPKIMDYLAEKDFRFRAVRIGGSIFQGGDALMTAVTAETVRGEIEKRNAVECVYLVGQRELDRAGFHATIGDRLADDLAKRLNF